MSAEPTPPLPGDIYKRMIGGHEEYWLLCNKYQNQASPTAWCCAILTPTVNGILGFNLDEPRLASDEDLEQGFTYHDTIARLVTHNAEAHGKNIEY